MNTPTKITIARICLIPVFVTVFLLEVIPYGKFIATFVFIIAALTDWLDGYLARKYDLVTDLGKFLDPIADKLLVTAALILIILQAPTRAMAVVLAVAAILIISRELIVSGFRIIASSKSVVLAADKLGKLKTVLQIIALILLLPFTDISALSSDVGIIVFYFGLGFLSAAALMTVISGINYIVKNREVLK